jgi:aspartyl-tRNA(Asn)/glutamyl-tRNA(Gln) amidotransferase subunit A
MYLQDIYTVSVNVAGLPAVSVPCGMSDGLPVGLQLIGRHFDEKTILGAAKALERTVTAG